MHPADEQEFDNLNKERHKLRQENLDLKKVIIEQAEIIRQIDDATRDYHADIQGIIHG